MPTTTTGDKDILFWQESEEGIPEPAILIQPFSDILCLETAEGLVNLNWDSLPEFIKILKTLKRPS